MFWELVVCLVAWVPPGLSYYHELSASWISIPKGLPSDSYFGYSITYAPHEQRLVVSAPQANNIGELYSCDIDSTSCPALPHNKSRTDEDHTHNYWFGAAVKSGANFIVSCSPLYVDILKYRNSTDSQPGIFSRCYKYSNLNEMPTRLNPINETERWSQTKKFEESMETFGWSMDVSDTNIIIGGPAMFTGRAISYENSDDSNPLHANGKSSKINYDFGYGVAIGKFRQKGNKNPTFAIGSPYGKNGRGMVAFYSHLMEYKAVLEGPEDTVGAMFGSVLCAVKLFGSAPYKEHALAVGAPRYVIKGTNEHEYDVGAVFIYKAPVTTDGQDIQIIKKITAKHSGSHFGSAIISLGDLNGDDRDELAIAAPYEGEGTGAVYIYSSAMILSKKNNIEPWQKIVPEKNANAAAFGLSLTPLQNHDKKGCNELAIGAPDSNKVMVLRCLRSVIVSIPELISAPKEPSDPETVIRYKMCLNVKYPKGLTAAKARVNMKVTITHENVKLADPKDNTHVINIKTLQQQECVTLKLDKPLSGRYDKSVLYSILATEVDSPLNKTSITKEDVIISDISTLSRNGSFSLAQCNSFICHPDLKYLKFTVSQPSTPYIIGSSSTLNVNFFFVNEGDTAYDSCVKITVEGTTVKRPSQDCEHVENSINKIMCASRLTLFKDSNWETSEIQLETSSFTNAVKMVKIQVEVFDSCSSTISTTKTHTVQIDMSANTENIIINGATDSNADEDVVKVIKYEEVTKPFEQTYTITNNGLMNWVDLTAEIHVQKRAFITNVTVYPSNCVFSDDDNEYIYQCYKEKFDKDEIWKIAVPMVIIAENLETIIKEEQNTVYAKLILKSSDGESWSPTEIVSKVILVEGKVALWIIVLAAFGGLLLLLLLVFILRKCGFFQRDKKEELKKVERSVKRQTIMRRSMMERSPAAPDQHVLVEEDENNEITSDTRPRPDNRVRVLPDL